ncbi:MAG: MGMT family protein [Treponema sp.]|jgi:methylated-DNA-protein-cysteine methyltransferase-like protein|nr:MGMT family protein [Treponema sp.]
MLYHPDRMNKTTEGIVKAILSIPRGRVSCYRDVALAAGLPNGARQVVRVLHSMSEKYSLPWHRVIRADGFIALDSCRGGDAQAKLLRAEGVRVSRRAAGKSGVRGWVDLSRFGHGCRVRQLPHGARTEPF